MTEKKPESAPTTKKLKSILKMLKDAGVASYKDSEVEIVFAPPMEAVQPMQQFNFDQYDNTGSVPEEQAASPEVDDLGFSEEDYLYRSAG